MNVGELVTRRKKEWGREKEGEKVGTCHINCVVSVSLRERGSKCHVRKRKCGSE